MDTQLLNPEHHTAETVVRLLRLEPLDREGGYFRRTAEGGPDGSGRRAWSSIHSLLTPDGFSAMHRLTVDEIWCFHAGDPLELLQLRPDGSGGWVRLGANPAAGESLQVVVPAGTWQGARVAAGGRWALQSCVTVPEFDWAGFELGERAALVAAYPAWSAAVLALTRSHPPHGQR